MMVTMMVLLALVAFVAVLVAVRARAKVAELELELVLADKILALREERTAELTAKIKAMSASLQRGQAVADFRLECLEDRSEIGTDR